MDVLDDEDWLRFLRWRAVLDIRTRFMPALADDRALRREESCKVATGDIDPARRLLTVRAENTKTAVVGGVLFAGDR
ncbi:hypothetical protein [Klebsiella pneumoniae]|uniref:hypothetical protein n=1 Tax=Klebsiella pneumoniae TaxID=573 RepID=UPI00294979EB|nr:hypothetical protein [Klebsiella pneumoniae]MDV5501097.1 hypothetical protein [Klebsiella pneumoniae]